MLLYSEPEGFVEEEILAFGNFIAMKNTTLSSIITAQAIRGIL